MEPAQFRTGGGTPPAARPVTPANTGPTTTGPTSVKVPRTHAARGALSPFCLPPPFFDRTTWLTFDKAPRRRNSGAALNRSSRAFLRHRNAPRHAPNASDRPTPGTDPTPSTLKASLPTGSTVDRPRRPGLNIGTTSSNLAPRSPRICSTSNPDAFPRL